MPVYVYRRPKAEFLGSNQTNLRFSWPGARRNASPSPNGHRTRGVVMSFGCVHAVEVGSNQDDVVRLGGPRDIYNDITRRTLNSSWETNKRTLEHLS